MVSLKGELPDGTTATTSSLTFSIVLNTEAPKFDSTLKTIYVRVEDTIRYILPNISDADGDNYTLTYSNLPRFGKYSSNSFTFSPTKQDAMSMISVVSITLQDNS